jgi:hypothetical protein
LGDLSRSQFYVGFLGMMTLAGVDIPLRYDAIQQVFQVDVE